MAQAQSSARGFFLAASKDFNSAIAAVNDDTGGPGGVEVYGRTGSLWHPKEISLIGSDAVGRSQQGYSAAISADGNTVLVGGPGDNCDLGAAWVFTRSEGVWRQQGGKLVGAGAAGKARQGSAVALSGDGDTAIVAGVGDDGSAGAVWVFTRSGGVWSQHWNQQGNKLVGAGAAGKARQGGSVALSSDGNTALVGGPSDDGESGAAWVFRRANGVWRQQGDKLAGSTRGGQKGYSVMLSEEGNAAVVSGSNSNSGGMSNWQFIRATGAWREGQERRTGGPGTATSVRPLDVGGSYKVEIQGTASIVDYSLCFPKKSFDDPANGANGNLTVSDSINLVDTSACSFPFSPDTVTVSATAGPALVEGNGTTTEFGSFTESASYTGKVSLHSLTASGNQGVTVGSVANYTVSVSPGLSTGSAVASVSLAVIGLGGAPLGGY